MYRTSKIEAGVDPRGSTGVKFGSKRVSKFGENIASLHFFQKMHIGQIYVLLNQRRGQKTAKNGQMSILTGVFWSHPMTFRFGFLVNKMDF